MSATSDDAIFEGRLRNNDFARTLVGAWYERQGFLVRIPPLRVRPTFADRFAYRDGGDVWVKPDKDAPERRVEVKTTTRPFQSAKSWQYRDMLVCKAKDWDEADPKPWRYVIVDATWHYGAVLRGDQMTNAPRRMQPDKRRGIEYVAIALPPTEFEFVKLR